MHNVRKYIQARTTNCIVSVRMIAQMFLSATRFNLDEVFTRAPLYDTKEKLFAADILSHKKCMNRYLLQYKRDMDRNISYNLEDFDEELKEQFRIMTENLDLDNNAYTVSYCCNFLNEKLTQNINNRQVKSLLIDHYRENICFTYPKDRKKSDVLSYSSPSSRCCRVPA